jgi:hypothetical protein
MYRIKAKANPEALKEQIESMRRQLSHWHSFRDRVGGDCALSTTERAEMDSVSEFLATYSA